MIKITEFLEARISEDETVAREAIGTAVFSKQTGRWVADDVRDSYGPIPLVFAVAESGARTQVANFVEAWEPQSRQSHVARHDPYRVLAECAAKRAILEQHKDWPVLIERKPEFVVDSNDIHTVGYRISQEFAWLTEQEYVKRFGVEAPTTNMIRALAAVYKDHPDYDPAWAIQT